MKAEKHFTETPEQKVMMQEFMLQINPVAAFIQETLKAREGVIARTDLYGEYVEWCKEAGHEALARNKFMQKFRMTIKQVMPEVSEVTTLGVRCFKFPRKYKEMEDFIEDEGEGN